MAEHAGFGTQDRDVTQVVTADDDRDGQVEDDLAVIMCGESFAPRRQRFRQSLISPAFSAVRSGRVSPGVGYDTGSGRVHGQAGVGGTAL